MIEPMVAVLGVLYIVAGFSLLVFRTRTRARKGLPKDDMQEMFWQVLVWPLHWGWAILSSIWDELRSTFSKRPNGT